MLKFAGDRAVGLGASDKELAALPVLTNEQIRALTIRASAIHRSSRDEVNAAAKRITAGRNAAALGIPGPLDLATFIPPDTVWVLDGLIPQGGSLGLFAERKPAGSGLSLVSFHSVEDCLDRLSEDAAAISMEEE
jgi:hypothetical protein